VQLKGERHIQWNFLNTQKRPVMSLKLLPTRALKF
jgi:hypothetical protein